MIIIVVETLMGDLRHTEKVVLVNSFPRQLTAQVLPPSYAPGVGTPGSSTFALVLGRAGKGVKNSQWDIP